MPDIQYLRQTMRAETAELPMHLPVERIHRRARRLRARRVAVGVTAVALLAATLGVSGYAVSDRARSASTQAADQTGRSCLPPGLGADGVPVLIGPVVPTGVSIEGADHQRYTVYLALTGTVRDPLFTVLFSGQTGPSRPWDLVGLPRGPGGDFAAKGRTWQFVSGQVALGADEVLDVGVYSRAAARITVASEGHTAQAHLSANPPTGMTVFWVERAARPLPVGAGTGPQEYQGPERLTITAYDPAGHVLHTVTGGFETGIPMSNPRDNSAEPSTAATRGAGRAGC